MVIYMTIAVVLNQFVFIRKDILFFCMFRLNNLCIKV